MIQQSPFISITISDKPGRQLRLEATRFHHNVYFNIRRWEEIAPSQWVPTKKGVTFSENLFPEFVQAIRKISEKLYRCDIEPESAMSNADDLQDQFVAFDAERKPGREH